MSGMRRLTYNHRPSYLYPDSLAELDKIRWPINNEIAKNHTPILYSDTNNYYYFEANSNKVLVLLHGGAWVAGDSTEMLFLKNMFSEHKVVTGGYTILTDNPHTMQACVDSVIQLVEHVKNNICPNVYLVGHSAGGHLAAVVATQIELAGVGMISAPLILENSSIRRNSGIEYPDQDFTQFYPGINKPLTDNILFLRGDHEFHLHDHVSTLIKDWDVPVKYVVPYDTDHFNILLNILDTNNKTYKAIEELLNA